MNRVDSSIDKTMMNARGRRWNFKKNTMYISLNVELLKEEEEEERRIIQCDDKARRQFPCVDWRSDKM